MTSTFTLILIALSSLFVNVCNSQSSAADDAAVLKSLRESLNSPSQLSWLDEEDPCNWKNVQCTTDKRVTRIQIGHQNLQGTLPLNLNKLTFLQVFEVQGNQLTGSLPSFAGLNSLKSLLLSNNNFTSIPSDFFNGTTSLQDVYLDYNPFDSWVFPDSLKDASALQTISATSANISGTLPDFFGAETFPSLTSLHLAFNYLEGPLPSALSGSSIQSLWLNGQMSSSKLNGSITILQNMSQLSQVWLHGNSFSGPLPDFTGLTQLKDLSLRDNDLTGPVPDSLVRLTSLRVVNLTNNLLQGKVPKFSSSVQLDMRVDSNNFCASDPRYECDSRVNDLLEVIQDFGYPKTFSENWKGNDPCISWKGISCGIGKNISVVNFNGIGLTGIIPPSFSRFTSLQKLILSNNKLYGTIPESLKNLPNLTLLDVSNNNIHGRAPPFKSNVVVKTEGNPYMGQNAPPPMIPDNKNGSSPGPVSGGNDNGNLNGNGNGTGDVNEKKKSNKIVAIAGSIVGVCGFVAAGVAFVICFSRSKRKRSNKVQSPHEIVIHPRDSGSDDAVKITIAGSSGNGGDGISETSYNSLGNSGPRDLHIVEAGNMVISIQVLRNVTNNFSEVNILGRGGFGTVYKGELHDGTIIAVKRMESGVMSEKGLDEFKSEISVLTKVRHRHLVALLGYCLDGNERLLVYEYMPQGTLSRYLFNWKEEGLKPLEWMKRLIIALDVARGVEYLHGLAHQSFIHRDLKPSNILLGDDMRAKVADFGLVREAPNGKASIATKLAGTFGYLAPEYAVTGRVSTKIDVFSFGVILMELITGRKSLDENLPDDSMHLVPWFRRTLNSKDSFHKAIDPTLDIVDEETLASIDTVAELAGHCSAREPYQRPDMGHAVNVLSSLAELWKPSEPTDPEDMYGIDYDMTLPQAVKKWQALEGMSGYDVTSSSSFVGSNDNTQTSIPTRPSGFADSFTSADGR